MTASTAFLEAINRLHVYQRESNDRILDVAGRISDEQFTSVIVEGQPSIRDTLFHMFDVIDIHFAWFNYARDRIVPTIQESSPRDFPDIGSLRAFAVSVSSAAEKCVQSLVSDSDLVRSYERAFPDGTSNRRVLWEMLLHVINHGTQHRSAVALMLTKLGHSPGDMEIL
ncbi:MAG: hypothetical protein O3B95_04120 [Chloroflexi bacterium]|nr:hypothetical protein [Chloroflexota bacterium]